MDGLAQRLKAARKAKKLTQQEVSEALDICRSAYTKYETGCAEPSLKSLWKLSQLYEIPIEDFLK